MRNFSVSPDGFGTGEGQSRDTGGELAVWVFPPLPRAGPTVPA